MATRTFPLDAFVESPIFGFKESTVFERIQGGIDFTEVLSYLYAKVAWIPRFGYTVDMAAGSSLNYIATSAQVSAALRAADGTLRRYGTVTMVIDSTTYTGIPNGEWGDPNNRVDTIVYSMTAYEGVTDYNASHTGENDPGVVHQYQLIDTRTTVTNTDSSVVFRRVERFGQDDGEGGTFINEDRTTEVTFSDYYSATDFDAEAWDLYQAKTDLEDQDSPTHFYSRDDDNNEVTDAPADNWAYADYATLEYANAAGWASYETAASDVYVYAGAKLSIKAEKWQITTRTYNIHCTLLSTTTAQQGYHYDDTDPVYIEPDGSHTHKTASLTNP